MLDIRIRLFFFEREKGNQRNGNKILFRSEPLGGESPPWEVIVPSVPYGVRHSPRQTPPQFSSLTFPSSSPLLREKCPQFQRGRGPPASGLPPAPGGPERLLPPSRLLLLRQCWAVLPVLVRSSFQVQERNQAASPGLSSDEAARGHARGTETDTSLSVSPPPCLCFKTKYMPTG